MEVGEFNFTTEEYHKLYLPYVMRPAKDLLERVELKAGETVLDLCSGASCRTGLAAVSMGAKHVVCVDKNPHVKDTKVPVNVDVFCKSIWEFLTTARSVKSLFRYFDVVVCLESINYWFDERAIVFLSALMKDGGRFIFNTFNTKPSELPVVKEYQLDGKHYVEVNMLIGDMVHHVQVREGMPPHLNVFRWIPPNEFSRVLGEHFEMGILRKDRSDVYICRKSEQ